MSIHNYPRCAAYLAACNYRLSDLTMDEKAWAICVSAAFTDEQLVKVGTIDFGTMSGPDLMAEFERLMDVRRSPRSTAAMESLKAYLGSRGIKVSALKSDDDYWTVSRILWPLVVRQRDAGPLSLLHHKIRTMSKAERACARRSMHLVPAEWLSASKVAA